MLEQIDLSFLKRDFLYCNGYALSISRSAFELPDAWPRYDNFAVAASNFQRAAQHSFLLGSVYNEGHYFDQGRTSLENAIIQYKEWGSPYAVLLAYILGNERILIDTNNYFIKYWNLYYPSHIRKRPVKLAQYIFLLISLDGINNELPILRTQLEPLRGMKVGLLGFSINQILNLFDAIKENNLSRITTSVFEFLNIYNEAIQIASKDRFHFNKLLMTFHPINFEVIFLLSIVKIHEGNFVFEQIERHPMNNETRSILAYIITNI